MMADKLFIHATNVHHGGGYSLLAAIIKNLPVGVKYNLSLDSRMPLPKNMGESVQIKRFRPSLFQRFLAELWLARNVLSNDIVLCFGNLPPLFHLSGFVVVFVQNRYLIDDVNLGNFPLKTRLRLQVERLWLKYRISYVDEFIVQTPTMKNNLDVLVRGKVPIKVIPFMESCHGYARKLEQHKALKKIQFNFLYVASGEPHKNHQKLIEAWCLLANEGIYPSLKLTLDSIVFADLHSWIVQMVEQYQLNVENLGSLSHSQVKEIYHQSGALIYPSTYESFGLPLIEARQAGLPVLASELDYVRDVLDPEQVFDPGSAISIARAVKRHLGVGESPLDLYDATGFIEYILQKAE